MKPKHLITLSLLVVFFITGYAQTKPKVYYFVVGNDTTFCKSLKYGTTAQGYLDELVYTDLKGTKTELKGRKNVPDVITFFMNGTTYDKVPLKADKPDSYIRYTERVVDGKLKVYLAQQGSVTNAQDGTSDPSGIYRFYLKMPDGTYYKINDAGNMKKYIKPYLLTCKEFESKYDGDFSTDEKSFIDMIVLYNSLCK